MRLPAGKSKGQVRAVKRLGQGQSEHRGGGPKGTHKGPKQCQGYRWGCLWPNGGFQVQGGLLGRADFNLQVILGQTAHIHLCTYSRSSRGLPIRCNFEQYALSLSKCSLWMRRLSPKTRKSKVQLEGATWGQGNLKSESPSSSTLPWPL